ncbi:BTAD domain-containing putative transcriptional regulator [Streptomyces sp. WG5]|uniref:AfsR/SARP family transcriptional regulator n=1 Tax=Streptomyces sp. WG5 TaxID=3417648 RepID=UPI003CF6C06C
MDFRILGFVSAEREGRPIALGGGKQRTVLAALLLARGRVVPDERLTTLLWDCDPPATSTKQLYTYVSRLRTGLGDTVVVERSGQGYRMDTGDASFDWASFRELREAGAADLAAGRHAEAERRLAAALALWNGPVLTGVTERFAAAEGPRLEEARLAVVEQHAEAALALGRHAESVPGLTRAVDRYPLHERLRGQLMTALYRCGRQADGLAVYEEGRRLLADELGIDPGPDLRILHQRILTATLPPPSAPSAPSAFPVSPAPLAATAVTAPTAPTAVAAPTAPTAVAAPTAAGGAGTAAQAPHAPAAGPAHDGDARPVPALVPAPPGDFTGRRAEVGQVAGALRGGRDVVVTGAPGTGKSVLARRAAEQCRDAFPDGHLYADLGSPAAVRGGPREILGWFLRALGAGDLPAGLDERVHLYRTVSAGRRLLVVLDGAVDDAQVRPLLPGGGACRTVVTGVRAPLASLEGTSLVRLGPMPPADAVRLLAAVAGRPRIVAEPQATVRLAELCDRNPLALRIAAARLAARPQWSVARLVARLQPEERRLAELRLGSLDVAVGLSAARDTLSPSLAAAFTALAASGAGRLTAADAALVLGTGADDAEDALGQLADAGLLEAEDADGGDWPSYRLPPLARLLARRSHGHTLAAA